MKTNSVPNQPCNECVYHIPSMGCHLPDMTKRLKCCWGEANYFQPSHGDISVKENK